MGLESDTRLMCVFIPSENIVNIIRRFVIHPINDKQVHNQLPSFQNFLDGLARENSTDYNNHTERDGEDILLRSMSEISVKAYAAQLKPPPNYRGISDGPPLQTSFESACQHPKWSGAIDRVQRTPTKKHLEINQTKQLHETVPFKWTFRAKELDQDGTSFLNKDRSVPCGDKQHEYIDYEPDKMYGPLDTNETIRMMLSLTAGEDLNTEGVDVDNAYLYAKLDIPTIMTQPTNRSSIIEKPGMVCLLLMSLYGTRQAGHIWGSVIHNDLLKSGFKVSTFDRRLYFFRRG